MFYWKEAVVQFAIDTTGEPLAVGLLPAVWTLVFVVQNWLFILLIDFFVVLLESTYVQSTYVEWNRWWRTGGKRKWQWWSIWDRKSGWLVLWGWPLSQRREGKHDKKWPILLAKLLVGSSLSSSSLVLLICKWFIQCNCVLVSNDIAPRTISFARKCTESVHEHQCCPHKKGQRSSSCGTIVQAREFIFNL